LIIFSVYWIEKLILELEMIKRLNSH